MYASINSLFILGQSSRQLYLDITAITQEKTYQLSNIYRGRYFKYMYKVIC